MESNCDTFPTVVNSQRKIDIDSRGVYHAAYESSGEIWYTVIGPQSIRGSYETGRPAACESHSGPA